MVTKENAAMYLHPELASALVADRIRDLERSRVGTAPRRQSRRGPARSSAAMDGRDDEVVIRLARAADAASLSRLGQLDGGTQAGDRLAAAAVSPDGRGAPLLAEVRGELIAAVDPGTGQSVANPFRPSAGALELLELRARQLRGELAAPRRGVRAMLRVGQASQPRRPARL